MTKDLIGLINKKIKELEKNLLFLKQISKDMSHENLKKDMIKYWGVERGIHICIEASIDIANIIISSEEVESPSTYKDAILILGSLKVLPQEFADELSKMVGFRNILVHDYTKIDEEILIDVLRNKLDDFIEYIDYVNKYLKENY